MSTLNFTLTLNIVMHPQLQSKVTNYMNGQPIIKLPIVVQFQAAYRQFLQNNPISVLVNLYTHRSTQHKNPFDFHEYSCCVENSVFGFAEKLMCSSQTESRQILARGHKIVFKQLLDNLYKTAA